MLFVLKLSKVAGPLYREGGGGRKRTLVKSYFLRSQKVTGFRFLSCYTENMFKILFYTFKKH